MLKYTFHLALSLLAVLIVVGCNESTIIGSDLLEDEAVNVKFVDTISVFTKTIPASPIDANGNANTYIAGRLNDPIFGISESDFYFAFDRVTSVNTTGATLDSVVLGIEYDTSSFYGNWETALYDLIVYKGVEVLPLIGIDSFSSNRSIAVDPNPITSLYGISINPYDTLKVFDPAQDSFILQSPHLRIKLENGIAQEMFQNLASIESDEDFDALYPSFLLDVIPNQSALVAFDAGNTARSAGINGLKFYYTVDSSGSKREYEYLFDRSLSTVRQEISGYPLEENILNPDLGKEILFVQGMGGAKTSVDISNLRSLQNTLINKVELEFTVAEGPAYFTDDYPPLVTYAAAVLQDGEYVAIQDLGLASSNPFVFNGILDTISVGSGQVLKKVVLNITNQVRYYLQNDSVSPEIIISSFTELEDPRRTVFYGPKSTLYPLKLNVAYTISQ